VIKKFNSGLIKAIAVASLLAGVLWMRPSMAISSNPETRPAARIGAAPSPCPSFTALSPTVPADMAPPNSQQNANCFAWAEFVALNWEGQSPPAQRIPRLHRQPLAIRNVNSQRYGSCTRQAPKSFCRAPLHHQPGAHRIRSCLPNSKRFRTQAFLQKHGLLEFGQSSSFPPRRMETTPPSSFPNTVKPGPMVPG
jgi:hypothetical protein